MMNGILRCCGLAALLCLGAGVMRGQTVKNHFQLTKNTLRDKHRSTAEGQDHLYLETPSIPFAPRSGNFIFPGGGVPAFTSGAVRNQLGWLQSFARAAAAPPARGRRRLFPSRLWGGVGLLAGAGAGWAMAGRDATASQRWHSAVVYGLTAGALTETSLALLRPHARVRWSRKDELLAGGIVMVQTLDDLGTRDFRRAGYGEWLLSNAEVDRRPQLMLTEAAVAGAGIGVMYLLERAGHRKWAHWLAGLYIAAGIASYYNNEHYARTGKSWF